MNVPLLAITTVLLLGLSGCGYNPERDKDCGGCGLIGANLDGVIDADFTGALNVPAKYLKR